MILNDMILTQIYELFCYLLFHYIKKTVKFLIINDLISELNQKSCISLSVIYRGYFIRDSSVWFCFCDKASDESNRW